MDIKQLYKDATTFKPYPYQRRLAQGDVLPQVLSVPTGVGKTAAAILSWLYRRRYSSEEVQNKTPRRLVYCLPMRTLVDQTKNVASDWLKKLGLDDVDDDGIGINLLMGGTDDGKWYEHPERDQILIGTQDMLLSRALNRGYGMSRYAWPVQYALLNNDCLWVLDETQLMGVGLTTSAQLEGFRKKLKTYGNCQTLWMSATLDAEAIETIDHPKPDNGAWSAESIDDEDRSKDSVQQLINAEKPCKKAELALNSDTKNSYATELAKLIDKSHRENTLTLVVLNRVQRAQETLTALNKLYAKSETSPPVQLIHSRFRPHERSAVQESALNDKNIPSEGRILIATQAIEAGVDLSSTTLISELAPWSSMVQRFGRCNRRGTCGVKEEVPAQVLWIDIDSSNPKKTANEILPYEADQLDRAREAISGCDDVGPSSLSEITVEEPPALVHVIRRKDLLDLFDTTPDLSGNDLDVSRYIRDSEDTDVQVYWREWDRKENEKGGPPTSDKETFPAAVREELCSVPVGQFKAFHKKIQKNDKKKRSAWAWNGLEKKWEECNSNSIRPGQTIVLHTSAGGYDTELGWTGNDKQKEPVEPCPPEIGELEPSYGQEETGDKKLTVVDHLKDVGTSAQDLKDTEKANWDAGILWDEIIRAAWWHDVGKAHAAFQGAMRATNPDLETDRLWAKSGNSSGYLQYQMDDGSERKGYRHELASALAWLQQHDGEEHADLVAYLIAAHHGKVRLSIRSMPNENKPPTADRLFARGIWHDDELPEIEIGNLQGDVSAVTKLDLSLMQLGEYTDRKGKPRPSWLARTLQLRETYGPFQLGYLETLVRVADWRGSAKGRQP